MKSFYQLAAKSLAAALLTTASFSMQGQSLKKVQSQWVYFDAQDKLAYKTLEGGDKIMDFSYAGYRGGGVRIPSPAVKVTVSPSGGDNTEVIQKAIDEVSKMKLINGFRGAVLLKPGTYNCEKTININACGVVLRGSGSGENGSIINMTGKPHNCISVRANVEYKQAGQPVTFAGVYVPSGTAIFSIKDASGFVAGDTISIIRPVTKEWIQFMKMDSLVRNGKKQTWINGEITTHRVIRKIEKNKITVDVPLTDSYDPKCLEASVVKIHSSGELSQVGIEGLRIVSAGQSVTINEGHNKAFSMSGLADGWARDIAVFNTVNSISVTGRRITVENVSIVHDLPTIGAAKPADINGSGQQLLFNQCTIKGDNLFFFGTGAKVTGPVVVLNCTFRGNGWIQPHQRWATGLLIDNCEVPDGGIDFMNRGEMGSGHGWAIGWAVAWNCKAKSFLNQRPPGAANWVIGSTGEKQKRAMPFNTLPLLSEGIYDAYETPVAPSSLYLAQLSERLGRQAVKNIGYGDTEISAAPFKNEERQNSAQ
jgi:pectin methylesterase-like acyl-CoA thioesterase